MDKVSEFSFQEDEVENLKLCASDWSFWSATDTLKILERESAFLLYLPEPNGRWGGLVFFQKAEIFTDLLFVYVDPELRKQGIATDLFQAMVAFLKKDLDQKFLEVRMSNRSAQLLYEKAGMKKIEIKKTYYSNGEDALIYELDL